MRKRKIEGLTISTIIKTFCLLLVIYPLLLCTCSFDGENATISISLASNPNKATVNIDELVHTITLSGPTGSQIYTISGTGTVKATVAVGLWQIRVEAHYGNELYAVGSASAEVRAGKNTDVMIKMTVVWTEPGSSGTGAGSTPSPFNPGTVTPTPPFDPGDGTAANPFKVFDIETLEKVGTGADGWDLDKHYEMTDDITLTLPTGYDSNFAAIGTDIDPFTGSFNGNGKKILNLTINEPASDFQGLFGIIDTTGIVENISLVDCSVIGGNYAGGVAGVNFGGTVENCYVTGSVKGEDSVGGVVGGNAGTMQNCHATGTVTGSGDSAGGVVGENQGMVENCSFTLGSLVGGDNAGGVVGYNSAGSTVENCYATGSVSGSDNVGGVVGDNFGIVEKCYATGNVESSNNSVGGVVGFNSTGSMVKNCYYATGSVEGPVGIGVGGVVGVNTAAMQNCFATGSVEGDNYVGGVVGWNNGGTVENCVALNPSVEATTTLTGNIGRVGWNESGGTMTNNFARPDMTTPSHTPTVPSDNDGDDISIWNPAWFESIGFTDPWWTGQLPDGP